jgi:hypothetical protein
MRMDCTSKDGMEYAFPQRPSRVFGQKIALAYLGLSPMLDWVER